MKRIKSARLTEGVQQEIRSYIAREGLGAGDMLPTEKALEEALGISRTSIREALTSLEAIGVVETRHGIGRFLRGFNFDAVVASLTYNSETNTKSFMDVINIRMALEHAFIVRVLPLMEEEDYSELRRLIDEMAELIEQNVSEEKLISAHTAFHLTLYRKLDNRLLSHLIEMFSTLQRALTDLRRYRTSDTGEFIRLHRELVDALESGNESQVHDKLEEHFKDVIAWTVRESTSATL